MLAEKLSVLVWKARVGVCAIIKYMIKQSNSINNSGKGSFAEMCLSGINYAIHL
jgi:hypothetical protein